MLDNPRSPRVRAMAKLAKRSARQDTGRYLVEGPQAVREALRHAADAIVDIVATPAALERHPDLRAAADAAGIDPTVATDAVVDAIADTVTPQGIVAIARQQPPALADILVGGPTLLAICDEVRDPGNLGTIIRAADATGAQGVLLTGNTVDPHHPKVVRATTGSLFHLPVAIAGSLADTVAAVRAAGLRVVAADVGGEDILDHRARLAEPTAWLFGNEARGLEPEARALADLSLRLPIYGAAESLNLATAASVCLYESAFAQRAGNVSER